MLPKLTGHAGVMVFFYLFILLLIKHTQEILLLSPKRNSYIPEISLHQIGERTKINVLWKGKGICQTNARSKVEEQGKSCRIGYRTEEKKKKKKIQDKFSVQESSYSVITVDAKVKSSNMQSTLNVICVFPVKWRKSIEEWKKTYANSTLSFPRWPPWLSTQQLSCYISSEESQTFH